MESKAHEESLKDALNHLVYVTSYFSVIAFVAVVFDLVGHQLLPWVGVTSFVATAFVWASESLFAVDLLLLSVYVWRSLRHKLWRP